MYKLVDIFNTKYFVDHYDSDLTYFFDRALDAMADSTSEVLSEIPKVIESIESFKKAGVIEIDISEAQFVPKTMNTIMSAISRGVIICDTTNVHRDSIFTENRRREVQEYITEPLPELKDIDEIPIYIKNMRTDVVYTLPEYNDLNRSIVTLLTIMRPEVNFDLNGYYESVFKYVANHVVLDEDIWGKYNAINGSTLYGYSFNNGQTYVLTEGYIDYDRFRNLFTYLPTCFGEKCLAKDPLWRSIQVKAVKDIQHYLSSRRITITDIYPRRV